MRSGKRPVALAVEPTASSSSLTVRPTGFVDQLRTAATTRVRVIDDRDGDGSMVLELINLSSASAGVIVSNGSRCWGSEVSGRFVRSFAELAIAIRPGPGGALVATDPGSDIDGGALDPCTSVTMEVPLVSPRLLRYVFAALCVDCVMCSPILRRSVIFTYSLQLWTDA